jgi:DnaJ domain
VPLVETEARWAGAWVRVLRGEPPFPKPREERAPRDVSPPPPTGSRAWALQLLGLQDDASADAVKRAFRVLALRTHPDRGGDAVAFMEAKRALDAALRVRAQHGKAKRRR